MTDFYGEPETKLEKLAAKLRDWYALGKDIPGYEHASCSPFMFNLVGLKQDVTQYWEKDESAIEVACPGLIDRLLEPDGFEFLRQLTGPHGKTLLKAFTARRGGVDERTKTTS